MNVSGEARPLPTTDDLDQLLEVLPPHICDPLQALQDRRELLEVVMDLGREPEARMPGREVLLSTHAVTEEDIDYVVQRIGAFGDDNRAGIERTLHRISAIRNREGRIVGITCRVGRAVFGTITIIRDIVESGRSILMMGRPGVGKTTLLREAARVLADDLRKRVMIVDTSNEIGGDGDIPHPAVGRARRRQVPTPSMQHAVMIEAVENHMPEVIVIDEIGTELEAAAARTIIGTLRRECLDHLIVVDEHHLLCVLRDFVGYYNWERPHRTLGLQTPERRPRAVTGPIHSRPILNGMHHVYERVA
jgi:stage III sporulation protein SpoIIIAA